MLIEKKCLLSLGGISFLKCSHWLYLGKKACDYFPFSHSSLKKRIFTYLFWGSKFFINVWISLKNVHLFFLNLFEFHPIFIFIIILFQFISLMLEVIIKFRKLKMWWEKKMNAYFYHFEVLKCLELSHFFIENEKNMHSSSN